MIRLVLCLAEPILAGYCLAAAILPASEKALEELLLELCLAFGLGCGLFSCLFFFWRISGLASVWFWILQGTLLAALAANLVRVRGAALGPALSRAGAASASIRAWKPGRLEALFLAVAGMAVAAVSVRLVCGRYGDVDAWSIWNLHARFLFRGGGHWTDYVTQRMARSHPDYPLLLPGAVAGEWQALGRESVWIPVCLSFGYTAATAVLLAVSLSRGGLAKSWVAGAVLLGTSEYLYQGSSQLADVPLAFYFLATITLLFPSDGAAAGSPFLAGLAAGCAAWTKNEGILFLLVISLVSVVGLDRSKSPGGRIGALLRLAAGAVLPFAALLFFKRLSPPNDLVAGQGAHATLSRILDGSRYAVILEEFVKVGFSGAHIGLDMSPLLLALYVWRTGIDEKGVSSVGFRNSAAVVALMGLGYFFVYLLTPQPLLWHLDTSLARLFIQLWPCMIYLAFVAAREPARVL